MGAAVDGQGDSLGGDSENGAYCSETLVQVLERHIESQEDHHGRDT